MSGSSSPVAWDDEDQRLDDLPELDTKGRGGIDRGVGRLVEDRHLERHALPLGRVEDALDRGVDAVVGHGQAAIARGAWLVARRS